MTHISEPARAETNSSNDDETEHLRERIARAFDEDHEANGFTLGRVEWGEHRRMADVALAALDLEPSGVWYCRRHSGTVNEDERRGLCPWWEHADHCEAEHDEGLDDGACSPCQWVELVIPPAALTGSRGGPDGE